MQEQQSQRATESEHLAVQRKTRGNSPLGGSMAESPSMAKQRSMAELANTSARSLRQGKVIGDIQNSPRLTQLQARSQSIAPDVPARKVNGTGLPDQLKAGIENLSGLSMDGVKVHYNSSKPAQLQAHAYAQGMDIHLAPGQERHLPHEAWHVVQQAQGRVRPTMQMKTGVPINDDAGLEQEADIMGARAHQAGAATVQARLAGLQENYAAPVQRHTGASVAQLAPEAVPTTVARSYSANGDGSSNVVEAQVNSQSDGGVPSCLPTGWGEVLTRAPNVKGAWVRFHLLNQYLGGSGARTDNLVPTSVGINNNGTWRSMEQEAQGAALLNTWVWWRTQVTYHAAGAGHGVGFPSNINVQSKKWDGTAWVNLTAGGGNFNLGVTAPNFVGGQVQRYFHEITGAQWSGVFGVTNTSLINAMVRHSAEIHTVDDLSTKVFYAEQYNFEHLEDEIARIDDAILGNNPNLRILLEE